MEAVKCERKDCPGFVVWDKEDEVWICDECSTLYE